MDGLGELDAFAATTSPRQARAAFARFLAWLRATATADVAQHYVQIFDLRRRCALYLTYYRYGDTRKRGLAIVAFKAAYREEGFIPSEYELPDYLPMVLDFAALTERGRRLLRSRRTDLELLRRALARAGSPYEDAVAAVCAHLRSLPQPGPGAPERARHGWAQMAEDRRPVLMGNGAAEPSRSGNPVRRSEA